MVDSWLNPLVRMKVREAYLAGKKSVKLADGRTIVFEEVGSPDRIYIGVKGKQIPMSILYKDRLVRKDWVGAA